NDCSGALDRARTVEDFLAQLQSVKVARCDVPALRILGLSLAGWNAVVSATLAIAAMIGAAKNIITIDKNLAAPP
ncbi:MAG: disulfide bond formation protein B, partial [Nitrososphaera sp.]|nr:disulfide bond formation protein B [Nitrososphaera sp.]